MTLPKKGFPSAVNMGLVGLANHDEQREAAKAVTDTLKYDCADVFEALGFTGYHGYEFTSTGPKRVIWREGTLK